MNIFDLSLLERAESVHADRDSVELVVNGVTISYRKYLNGFAPVVDVELDGASYYRNYGLDTTEEFEAAKSFFACSKDEDLRRRTVTKFPIYKKLQAVFADAANC
jgi:hypothetical protein